MSFPLVVSQIHPERKRLKTKCAPKNSNANIFLQLPDAALSMIAECALPVEVYQLILSNKHFLTTTTEANDNKFISSYLLRSSIISNLDYVLKCQKAGFTVSDFQNLCNQINSLGMPHGSIYLAGSTMVQALMGRTFDKTDIDLYVTEAAAPAVRTWLTSTKGGANLVWNSIRTNYKSPNGMSQFVDNSESKMSTVEKYSKMPTNQPIFLRRSKTRAVWVKVVEVTEVIMKPLPIAIKPIKPLHGTKMRTFRKYMKDVDSETPSGDIDSDASTFDEPRPTHAADVIICKQNATPLQIIEQFDLEICKARFNGESFFIPNPRLTFQSSPSITNPGHFIHSPATIIARNKDVLTTFFQEPFQPISTTHRLLHLEQNCDHLSETIPLLQYVHSRGYHFGNTTIPTVKLINTTEKESKCIINQIHNVIKLSVSRFNKYNCRGIQVLEIPQALLHPPFKKESSKQKILYNIKPF